MRSEALVVIGGVVLLVLCCAGPLLLAAGGASLILGLSHAQPGIIAAPLAVTALGAAFLVFRHRHRKSR
jgi:hypothetical protein